MQKRQTARWSVKRASETLRPTNTVQGCASTTKPKNSTAPLCSNDQNTPYRRTESQNLIEITGNRIVTPRPSHRNGDRQKKRKRREKRFHLYAFTTPRFVKRVPSHHAIVPRGNCMTSTNVVVTIPQEQSIHHQGGRVRFTGVLHPLGASCRRDSLHSFLQSEHFARQGGRLGSLQHRPFCTSR